MPDAKFDSGRLSSSGDMTGKFSLSRREQVIRFGYLPQENGFNFKKKEFSCPESSFRPKIDPHVNFSNFQAEENFFIFKIFETTY